MGRWGVVCSTSTSKAFCWRNVQFRRPFWQFGCSSNARRMSEVAHVTGYADIGIASSLKPTKPPLAAARALPAVCSDLLFARMDFLMFRGKDKRKDHTSREVLDGVDDDIGVLPYMVTVTTTKPITPLFLPDPVDLFTIRLVSGSNFWKRYVWLRYPGPWQALFRAIFRVASPEPAHSPGTRRH